MQVEAIKWMWSIWNLRSGGILADDMGLGKTLTTAAFLAGLIQARTIRRALIVAPKTLLAHWTKELAIVGLGKCTFEYTGTQAQRRDDLARTLSRRSVLLTTYGMVLHNKDELTRFAVPARCTSLLLEPRHVASLHRRALFMHDGLQLAA
jgi:DNA excision repair protein ERCC-6-like